MLPAASLTKPKRKSATSRLLEPLRRTAVPPGGTSSPSSKSANASEAQPVRKEAGALDSPKNDEGKGGVKARRTSSFFLVVRKGKDCQHTAG